MMRDDGQVIFGDLGGLKLPDICLTGEENLLRCNRILPGVVVVFRTLPDYVSAPAQKDSRPRPVGDYSWRGEY